MLELLFMYGNDLFDDEKDTEKEKEDDVIKEEEYNGNQEEKNISIKKNEVHNFIVTIHNVGSDPEVVINKSKKVSQIMLKQKLDVNRIKINNKNNKFITTIESLGTSDNISEFVNFLSNYQDYDYYYEYKFVASINNDDDKFILHEICSNYKAEYTLDITNELKFTAIIIYRVIPTDNVKEFNHSTALMKKFNLKAEFEEHNMCVMDDLFCPELIMCEISKLV